MNIQEIYVCVNHYNPNHTNNNLSKYCLTTSKGEVFCIEVLRLILLCDISS